LKLTEVVEVYRVLCDDPRTCTTMSGSRREKQRAGPAD